MVTSRVTEDQNEKESPKENGEQEGYCQKPESES